LFRKPEGKRLFGKLRADGKVILKQILNGVGACGLGSSGWLSTG
jgi:hypothetical protein